MEAIAHNKAFAKKVGVPQSVGREFSNADKGKTFRKGGLQMNKMDPKMMAKLMAAKRPAMPKRAMPPMGGRMAADNQMMQAGTSQPGTPAMMKKGGMTKKMNMGGMAKGGGVEIKGKTKGTMIKMNAGGMKKMTKGGRAC